MVDRYSSADFDIAVFPARLYLIAIKPLMPTIKGMTDRTINNGIALGSAPPYIHRANIAVPALRSVTVSRRTE